MHSGRLVVHRVVDAERRVVGTDDPGTATDEQTGKAEEADGDCYEHHITHEGQQTPPADA